MIDYFILPEQNCCTWAPVVVAVAHCRNYSYVVVAVAAVDGDGDVVSFASYAERDLDTVRDDRGTLDCSYSPEMIHKDPAINKFLFLVYAISNADRFYLYLHGNFGIDAVCLEVGD